MSRRIERLNGLFQEELSVLIRDEVRDPRMAEVVSITRVDISPDLENATVHISVLGDDDEKRDSLQALEHAAPFLRRRLIDRVRIRRVPNLHFLLDQSIEEAARILALMKQVGEHQP